jgi:predicted DNA-binding WGR domain protein
VRLEFRTEKRGYTLWLERDMLGDWVLFRRWFGLHTRRGGIKRQVFLDENVALKEVKRIERLRFRRGYQRLDSPIS